MTQALRSPVPQEVSTELERVVQRWHQLPLDQALSYAGRVRALVQSLADRIAIASGVPGSKVPDLGPATLMDQLTVLVYDASVAAGSSTARQTQTRATPARTSTLTSAGSSTTGMPTLTSTLARDLASLRRELS